MKKVLLAVLVAAMFLPSMARAANVTVDFLFQQTTGSYPLAIPNATYGYGIGNFTASLAKDIASKAGCDLSATGKAAITKTIAGVLKGITTLPFDYASGTGYITIPENAATGPSSGTLFFGGYSLSTGLKNSQLTNTTNTPSLTIVCGGQTAGSGTGNGVCGNSLLCLNKNLNATDPYNLTNCQTAGGTHANIAGQASLELFLYPVPGVLCNGEATYAECCGDPNLVIIGNSYGVINDQAHGGPYAYAIITGQGAGGTAESYQQ